ncbi:MAG: hypothetical protein HY043_13350 [Verrucomicrobia bacterium]|nr:hypothetical protein [Verrucomicrobiota bacterium]
MSAPLRNVRLRPAPCGDEDAQRAREQECYERGRHDGERTLSEQLLQQRNELLELQQGVFESLRQAMPQLIRECEQALVALSLEAASKLVAGLPVSGEMVEAAIRDALTQVEQSSEFTVLLHADDLTLLQKINSPLVSLADGVERIRFRSSREVTRGGCLVQTKFGHIDGRREAKLEALQKSLLS